jgi:single-stranded-DNA-specific exonuclease
LAPSQLAHTIETDGILAPHELQLGAAESLQQEVWGQGFAPPLFHGEFALRAQRIVGQKHSQLALEVAGTRLSAVLFGHTDPLPPRLHAVYRLGIDEFNGARRLQLGIEHWEPAS